MKKITKGALAMVLVGSVTFSVINALLTDQPSKRFVEGNSLTMSGDKKKADVTDQAENTVKDQTPTTNVKDVQTMLSHDISAFQSDIQQNKEQFTQISTLNSANTDTTTTTTPAATTIITTSLKAPKTTTTTTTIPAKPGADTISDTATTIPATTGTDTTNETTTTTTTTNHGQQVSQIVREKAATHQDKKGNNGKKVYFFQKGITE